MSEIISGKDVIEVDTHSAVRVVFTTRQGGFSSGTFGSFNLGSDLDDPRVADNRNALCERLAIDAERVVMARQVHGTTARARWSRVETGDSLATSATGPNRMVL